MKNDLRAQLNAALRDVDWHGEERVLRALGRRSTPARRRIPTRALVLAILLLMLLAATAAAFTLHFSGRFDRQMQARQAVQSRYGLTDEMMGLFTYQAIESDGPVIARFTMNLTHADKLGVYTVERLADGSLRAAWSHDGADAAAVASGALSADAWGAKQLERVLLMYRERMDNWSAVLDYGELTLEERAVLDAPMLQAAQAEALINIAPEARDIAPEDARRAALEAIELKYGVTAQMLSGYHTDVHFHLYGGTQRREYRFDFTNLSRIDSYIVYVASPRGAVTYCAWLVEEEARALPAGDLGDYAEAAKEFVTSGAFDILPPEDKALAAARYHAAGLDALLPRDDYVSPGGGDLTESAARLLAQEALAQAYGLPDGWTALFRHRTSLVSQADGREWVIQYLPRELGGNWHWREFEKLGTYTAALHAQTGRVASLSWSFEGMALEGYTSGTFAAAPAYAAYMLPYLQALLADVQVILDKYPVQTNLDEMTLEDRGAYDALMRGAGYSPQQHSSLIPTDKDIAQDAAAQTAWEALNEIYVTEGMRLARGEPFQEGLRLYRMPDGSWIRMWSIVYTNNQDIFTIQVNAQTGEVENIWHDSPAFGNG